MLGSPFWDQAMPLPSPFPPSPSRKMAFHEKARSLGNAVDAQVLLPPWVVTSPHQEGVQDPLLRPRVGAAPASPLLHPTPLGSCHVQSSFLMFACDKRFSTRRRNQVRIYQQQLNGKRQHRVYQYCLAAEPGVISCMAK